MYKKALKITYKILGWTALSLLTIFVAGAVIVYAYEDDIKAYAIQRLNKQLNAKVRVHSIELSFWEKFPYASLNFKGVVIKDAHLDRRLNTPDTLLYAENMYLEFSVWDIWGGNYSIKKIESNNGFLNLKINQNGDGNYHFLKPSDDATASEFEFDLESVHLTNYKYQFKNKQTGQYQNIAVEEIDMIGDFNEVSYDLHAEARGEILSLSTGDIGFIKDREFQSEVDLHVENNTDFFLQNGTLKLEEMNFKVEGELSADSIDLAINGDHITFQEFVNSFSGQIFNDVYSYQANGLVDFDFSIVGAYNNLDLNAAFTIENGEIFEPKNKIKVSDINLNGSFSQNERGNKLDLKTFELKIFNGFLNGTAKIKNLAKPNIKLKVKGNLDLAAVDKIFHLNNINNPSGTIILNTQIAIENGESLKNIKGNFEFKNVSLKLKEKHIQNATGKLAVNNNNIALKNFHILFESSDLSISGAIKNFRSYVNKKGTLYLITTVKSNYINLEDFMFQNEEYEAQTGILPENINLNVDLTCQQFEYYSHRIDQIKLNAKMLNKRLLISKLNCVAYGGKISGNIDFDNRNSPNSLLDVTTNLRGIDIQAAFKDWDNFGQKSILWQNLSGKANIKAHILLPFDQAKNLIKEKLYAQIEMEISKGELSNLSAIKSIAESMRENKMVHLFMKKHIGPLEQKLLHLKFEKLSNKIIIKDSKISIPKMNIKTNAFDLNMEGMHHFNNDINYRFDFRFRELKNKVEYTEFGKIEDDGTGFRVYLKMYGNTTNPIIEWDKESKKEKFKEDLKEEKETLKSMLKKEFGLFKKDTTVSNFELKKKEEEFMMYDGEFDSQGEPNLIPTDTVHTNAKKKKKINNLFKKIKEENKKEENIEFEIEN